MKISLGGRIKRIADFIFPRSCVMCAKINPKGKFDFICPDCAREIPICKAGKCLRCGEIVGGIGSPDADGCPKCAEMEIAYRRAHCPALFAGCARELIHALKYQKKIYAARDLAKIALLHPDTARFLNGATLVPVPITRKKRIARGYNQAEAIIREIVRLGKLDCKIAGALKRTKQAGTQTTLDRARRIKNVEKAFELSAAAKNLDKNARIIICDDVITTAATINECAKVLRKAGFENLYAFAIAKRM